jgi:peroxiredoxin Q/BCP
VILQMCGKATDSHDEGIVLARVNVGDKAPDFTLSSNTEESVTLSQFFGKSNVVLFFYPKDESRGCTKEACAFKDSYEVFKDLGAEVLGINAGDSESHQEFVNKYMLPFKLLVDRDNKVRLLYGVPSTLGIISGRVTYVIDKKGIVRHIFSSQFQPEKHIEDAISVLRTLE